MLDTSTLSDTRFANIFANTLSDLQIFYLILWIVFFTFLMVFILWSTKVFNFDEVQFIYFFFCHLCFAHPKVTRIYAYIFFLYFF